MFNAFQTLPPWAAPILGALAGAVAGGRAVRGSAFSAVQVILGGMVLGGLAGCLVFLLDRPSDEAQTIDLGYGPVPSDEPSHPVIPRFFAFLSCALFWAPIVGSVVALFAMVINWRTPGLRRKLSIGGFLASLPLTCITLVAITMKWA